MSEELAARWLGKLVSETKIAFSTQKQALNALVFFFRDVCGRAEVRLDVRMRKRERRIPVVPSRKEVMRLIEKLEGVYKTAAKVQYGSGLRLRELVTLRVRDVDLERGTVTVRCGKGNKDRVTILPEAVKEEIAAQLGRGKGLWKADREAGRPGVALPNALARKKPKAGERWEWHGGRDQTQFPNRVQRAGDRGTKGHGSEDRFGGNWKTGAGIYLETGPWKLVGRCEEAHGR